MTAALRRWTGLPSAQPEEDASSAQLAAATTRTDAVRSGATTPPLPAGAKALPVLQFEAQSSAPRGAALEQRLRSCTVAQHTAEWYSSMRVGSSARRVRA